MADPYGSLPRECMETGWYLQERCVRFHVSFTRQCLLFLSFTPNAYSGFMAPRRLPLANNATAPLQALFSKATAPLKQVGMMCFMAWMFGNSIQIFSIFMTFNLISAPVSAIMSSGEGASGSLEWARHVG